MIDDPGYQRALDLISCVCAELAAADLPEPCYCGLFYGGDAPFDYCDSCDDGKCGQVWVRLVGAYPSSSLPEQDPFGTCATMIAYQWEVGVIRCAPTLDEQGNPPSVEANLEATRLQYADMGAMRRAIQCCFGDEIDYVLGVYTPYPVLGACTGGFWAVTSW